ncbi:rhodanese-like domain-containing protein [Chryseobacterium sp. H3056]|uniref:Rhodanese-like domain-containing protein n=1 Tax=Kaistella daneshvariae TaxID=2487074 RepID=A0A3N0WV46_9FLAO|nr:rhodanese-like domain-containing protein [Kaistella daneshvariae]ROI07999.1 rhodanese-like domain-containing protein [Kaistella daneshvariae]
MKKLFFLMLISVFVMSCQTQKTTAVNSDRTEIKPLVLDPETVLVDVRIPEQFAAKTAEGAINIPLGELQNNLDMLKGKNVVVFCNSGRQASEAEAFLKKNDVKVYNAKTLQNVEAIKNEKK